MKAHCSHTNTLSAKPALGPRGAALAHSRALTHRAVHVFAALLILLLYPLLQEVDAELEAEVLLLQVIQVLRQSTVTVRHDHQRAPTPFDMSRGQSEKKYCL